MRLPLPIGVENGSNPTLHDRYVLLSDGDMQYPMAVPTPQEVVVSPVVVGLGEEPPTRKDEMTRIGSLIQLRVFGYGLCTISCYISNTGVCSLGRCPWIAEIR